jgi:mannose-6-phosphate isomerase-like protein (cupin superfamily)
MPVIKVGDLPLSNLVVVPAGVPHAFTNTGDEPLRQIDIHVSPDFDTTWLD